MNHLEDAVRRLQRSVDANHQSCFNNSTEHTRASDWDTSDQYPRYTASEPHGSREVTVGWERLSPPAHNHQNQLPQGEDPDGEPLEMDSEDLELTRKRNELREIEEQIIQKKVALALKNVEPFMKKTLPGFCNEEPATCVGETLRDRVNVILQQRQSLSIQSKVPSPQKWPGLRKDSLLQEDHPLKLRVKALMKKRCADPCVLPAAVKALDEISSAKEVNSADKGFQRFLSILNKGVDMDLLSRIVNDDSDELLNIPTEGNEPRAHFKSESQRSNSGASLPGHSQDSSGEAKTEPTSRERSHTERKNERGDNSFGSSRRSKSPMAEKKKKKKKEETNQKLDEQREQLQNILKTLGLDLEVEEMSKLADRTQERLYGKKHESRNGSKELESGQRASQRHYSNSSSSSSSPSSRCSSFSSRSTSRSFSPSPSRRCRSYSRDSRDSKPRLACGRSSSSDRSRDRPEKQEDDHRHSKEPQTLKDTEEKDSTYQHPSYQMYPHPPGGFPSFPVQTLSQYSQSTTLLSGEYSSDTHSYWTYSQDAIPASFYSSGLSNSQNTYHRFPDTKTVYSHHSKFEDLNLLVNPDLSTSEGQSGSASGLRCLQVVSTRPASQRIPCLKQLTKSRKKRRHPFRGKKKRQKLKRQQQQQIITVNLRKAPVQTLEITKPSQKGEAKHPEEVKQRPTEEEIKTNLRKRLEAFNQMVKQKLSQPATSQLLQSVERQDYL